MRRDASRPRLIPVHISPSPPLAPSHPVRRAMRRSTDIKHAARNAIDCDIKERCRRDRAGPRIADDSQNVNSRLFPVKSVSQSVRQSFSDHCDYYVNSRIKLVTR